MLFSKYRVVCYYHRYLPNGGRMTLVIVVHSIEHCLVCARLVVCIFVIINRVHHVLDVNSGIFQNFIERHRL